MSNDLRTMEWLFHVDIDPLAHGSADEIVKSARMAWDCIQEHQKPCKGDRLVIAVVRPLRSEAPNGQS
jgi:hypothetical protein